MINSPMTLTIAGVQLELVLARYLYIKLGDNKHYIIKWNKSKDIF